MKSVSENLKEWAKEVHSLLTDLEQRSGIHDTGIVNDLARSGFAYIGADHAWDELDVAGKQIQSRVKEEYSRFYALLTALLHNQPNSTTRTLEETEKKILKAIEQDSTEYHGDVHEIFASAQEALLAQVELVGGLYDSSKGIPLMVPDTNALLYNTDIDKWNFAEASKFRIMLTPTVLSELDQLKVAGRTDEVRKKSEKLIRQIKEYRRRGPLANGVSVKKDAVELASVAIEPDTEAMLPWLSKENNDDRILASVISIMRSNPSAPVAIVTRDINMQNKSEFARVPYLEPPEPVSP
jgi:hypothetical protein